MRSLNFAPLALRALCRELLDLPPEAFARLTQDDVVAIRARIGQTWQLRWRRQAWRAGAALGVLAMVALFTALAVRASEPVPLGPTISVLLALCVAGLLLGCAVTAGVLRVTGSDQFVRVARALTPLSEIPGSCAAALETMDCPTSRAHRDAVLDMGRELCRQDLTHMEALRRDEARQARLQRHEQECLELHATPG